jgi:hypothetical protein
MFETREAKNGQTVVVYELDFLTALTYEMFGFNPDNLGYAVDVYSANDPGPDATIEETAPLHQEFTSTFEDGRDRMDQIVALINGDNFEYNPPTIPAL